MIGMFYLKHTKLQLHPKFTVVTVAYDFLQIGRYLLYRYQREHEEQCAENCIHI